MSTRFGKVASRVLFGVMFGFSSFGCGVAAEPEAAPEAASAIKQAVEDGDTSSSCPVAGYPFYYQNSTTDISLKYCSCLNTNNHIGVLVDADCGGTTLTCVYTAVDYHAECNNALASTYPMNRTWDPGNEKLGCTCITTAGLAGSLQSKCQTRPNTCGFLYCLAQ